MKLIVSFFEGSSMFTPPLSTSGSWSPQRWLGPLPLLLLVLPSNIPKTTKNSWFFDLVIMHHLRVLWWITNDHRYEPGASFKLSDPQPQPPSTVNCESSQKLLHPRKTNGWNLNKPLFQDKEKHVHPGKLTCPLKRDYFNRKYIFQPSFFRGYVSFQGCTTHQFLGYMLVFGGVWSRPNVANIEIIIQWIQVKTHTPIFNRYTSPPWTKTIHPIPNDLIWFWGFCHLPSFHPLCF